MPMGIEASRRIQLAVTMFLLSLAALYGTLRNRMDGGRQRLKNSAHTQLRQPRVHRQL